MHTTENLASGLYPMTDDAAFAMRAFRRQHLDRAFEGVKIMGDAVPHDFQGFVIFVPAAFARDAAVLIRLPLI